MGLKYKLASLFVFVFHLSFCQSNYSEGSKVGFYTEINYEWVNEKIIIPVEIEGKTYKFLLDTGAPNIITVNLKDSITTEFLKKIPVYDANRNKDSLDLVIIPLIKIGGVAFQNTETLINKADNNSLFDCFEIDGFIGSNLLKNSILQILPKDKVIKLTDRRRNLDLNRRQSSRIEFLDWQFTPYIWIELGANKKVNHQVYLDTGMSGLYDLANTHLEYFQKQHVFNIDSEAKGTQGTGLFGSENESIYYKVIVPELEVNGVVFTNTTAITTNDKNSRVGVKLLEYGNVTIDYLNRRFYYEPFQNIIDVKEKDFGFDPTVINNTYVVGLVWDTELKAKIKHGDRILAINGQDFSNSDFCEQINARHIFDDNDKLDFKFINSEGEEIEMTVFKK